MKELTQSLGSFKNLKAANIPFYQFWIQSSAQANRPTTVNSSHLQLVLTHLFLAACKQQEHVSRKHWHIVALYVNMGNLQANTASTATLVWSCVSDHISDVNQFYTSFNYVFGLHQLLTETSGPKCAATITWPSVDKGALCTTENIYLLLWKMW